MQMEDVATGGEVAGEVLYLAGDTPAVLSRVSRRGIWGRAGPPRHRCPGAGASPGRPAGCGAGDGPHGRSLLSAATAAAVRA